MPLNIVFNSKPSDESAVNRINHKIKAQKEDEVSKSIKMEYYAQNYNQRDISPRPVESGHITPRQRINFNFLNQPISPQRHTYD
jgi:hypothetical protein